MKDEDGFRIMVLGIKGKNAFLGTEVTKIRKAFCENMKYLPNFSMDFKIRYAIIIHFLLRMDFILLIHTLLNV